MYEWGSGIDLGVYADAKVAENWTDRKFVYGGVVVCKGATDS